VEFPEASGQMTTANPMHVTSTNPTYLGNKLYVDIKGEVLFPGVYQFETGTRLFQAIAEAGGATSDADLETINLTVPLTDGMMIVIPAKTDTDAEDTSTIFVSIAGAINTPGDYFVKVGSTLRHLIDLAGGVSVYGNLSGLNPDGVLKEGQLVTIPLLGTKSGGDTTEETDGLVDINEASLAELETLPGIGMIIAQRIIDYRSEYGPFDAIEDIMNVSGIKATVYAEIQDRIKV
jgi:competence protein ComEA